LQYDVTLMAAFVTLAEELERNPLARSGELGLGCLQGVYSRLGDRARRAGRRDLALALFGACSRLFPDQALPTINYAIERRDCGGVPEALAALDALLLREPGNVLAMHERAVCLQLTGRAGEAAECLRTVVSRDPTHRFARVNLFRCCLGLALFSEATQVLADLSKNNMIEGREQVRLTALLAFYKEHAAGAEACLREPLGSSAMDRHVAEAAQTARTLCEQIDARQPFSLIRLGDGEGALLAPTTYSDASAFSELLDANRSEFLDLWFGQHASEALGQVDFLTTMLRQAIANATFLALPDDGWIRRELSLASNRGLPSILAARLAASFARDAIRLPHYINRALNDHGVLRTVLSKREQCYVISPHPGLAAKIAARFDVRTVEEIVVPIRQADLAYVSAVNTRRHFPDVFLEVVERIKRSAQDSLFLVGAGPLGKLYCEAVRDAGGYAIDIGSVMDDLAVVRSRFFA
jgi:hypothetical protein